MTEWTKQENEKCLEYLDKWRQMEGNPGIRQDIVDEILNSKSVNHNEEATGQHMYYLDKITNGEPTTIQKDQWLIGIRKK